MDTQLLSFELYTDMPDALERFLSDVLQLEIEESPCGLFRVQWGQVTMDVLQGKSSPANFYVALNPQSFADLTARWEFFTFRYAERPEANFYPAKAIFRMVSGESWHVTALPARSSDESSEIHVRNC